MAELIKFTATRLNGTGKQGILKPDSEGYYEIMLGGLDVFNSAGEFYTLEGAKELFESSSPLMRRIKNGCLKGECGHPKRQPNQRLEDYASRIYTIEETNISHHIKEVWLDPSYGQRFNVKGNSKMVGIVGLVKPSGPKGPALQAALENKSEEVCFSIRAMTKDYYHKGTTYRTLSQIFTWDWVNEPGISTSTKWQSPALESIEDQFISRQTIESVVKHINENPFAIESDRQMALETLQAYDRSLGKVQVPLFTKW